MSWNFRKAGVDKAALIAAVRAETNCPEAIREEVAKGIEAVELQPHQMILASSDGHFNQPERQPSYGASTAKFAVNVVPLIDTPVA